VPYPSARQERYLNRRYQMQVDPVPFSMRDLIFGYIEFFMRDEERIKTSCSGKIVKH
jgi:hypothetical protein